MEYSQKLGLGVGGLGLGNPAKVFLVYSGITSDVRGLAERFGIDEVDYSTLIFSTIEEAVNASITARGDHIMVAPGHAETLSSATALALDKAGITIVGIGAGNNRPIITFDTATTATIAVSKADIEIYNIIFTANFADIVSVFTLTTANNFGVYGCAFRATAVNMNFLYIVDTNDTASDADGLTLIGNEWIDVDTVCETMVKMDEDNYRVTISDNFVQLGAHNNTATLLVIADGFSVFNLRMEKNRVFRLNTDTATGAILLHTNQSDNSGVVADNRVQMADTGSELLITASSGLGTFENYSSGVAGASGYLLPAADA